MPGKHIPLKRLPENPTSPPKRGHERRAYPRYEIPTIVSYAHRQKQLLTSTLNLSMGGMKIKAHQYLPKNEEVDFTIVLEGKSIASSGRVIYNKVLRGDQRISGIQFLGLSRRASLLLREHLSNLEARPPRKGMSSVGIVERVISDENKRRTAGNKKKGEG